MPASLDIVYPKSGAALAASGVAGATAASRYAGATVSGPPVSGSFAVGDFVIDQSGQMWICTTGGSPGTWQAPGSGRELGYAEITAAPAGVTVVGQTNRIDVTGLSVTVTVGARPVAIHAFVGQAFNGTASSGGGIAIVEGSTVLAFATGASAGVNGNFELSAWCRKQPSAGSHTYKVMAWAQVSGTLTLNPSATEPGFITVVER